MNPKIFEDLSRFLVYTYYANNKHQQESGISLVSNILSQLREAGIYKDVELTYDHNEVRFISKNNSVNITKIVRHNELPNYEKKEEVIAFIANILKEIFY